MTAEAHVVPPPKPKPPKEEPRSPIVEVYIPPPVPAKQFYFGEDEEDRLSIHSGHSWEDQPQVAQVVPPPVVPKPPVRVNELSRKPGAQGKV